MYDRVGLYRGKKSLCCVNNSKRHLTKRFMAGAGMFLIGSATGWSPLGFAPIQIGLISLIIVTLIVTYATKPTSAETLEKFFPAKVKAK